MIGVVLLGAGSARRVLGLSIALRGVLALQAAGAERVQLLGEGASGLALLAATDDRVRVRVEAVERWDAGGAVVLGEGVLVDARATRALARAGDDTLWRDAAGVLAGSTTQPGRTLEDLVPRREAPTEGVVVRAAW
jgi:hypothetical protein